MKIRKLKIKDAPLMLEWMHDINVVSNLQQDFLNKSIDDCFNFINNSRSDASNVHFAIVSDKDEYMGTVSLKHIDYYNKKAEFGIAVRSSAMGKGYSWFGMMSALDYAFKKLKLESVYWCVLNSNGRACHFYDKHNFSALRDIPIDVKERYKKYNDSILKWYIVKSDDNYIKSNNDTICGCSVVRIKTIGTTNLGQLSFFEAAKNVPFSFKRFYYISKVPEGGRRGFHAHKELKQLIFCPFGQISLVLDDGERREEVLLNDPSIGVIIEKPIWREMVWLKADSVLCVVASDYYSEDDYIRNYNDFLRFISKKNS